MDDDLGDASSCTDEAEGVWKNTLLLNLKKWGETGEEPSGSSTFISRSRRILTVLLILKVLMNPSEAQEGGLNLCEKSFFRALKKISEYRRGSFSAEFYQEPAGRILMDTCDNDLSLTHALLDNHCCRFTSADTIRFMLRKNAIAFDRSGIIIINDRAGTGTGCKGDAPQMAVMPVNHTERQPVISVRLVSRCTEYQKGAAVFHEPLDAR